MISGDGWGLSFPDICLTVEEKTSTRKTDPTRESNQGPTAVVMNCSCYRPTYYVIVDYVVFRRLMT